jgi:hypothetical protein
MQEIGELVKPECLSCTNASLRPLTAIRDGLVHPEEHEWHTVCERLLGEKKTELCDVVAEVEQHLRPYLLGLVQKHYGLAAATAPPSIDGARRIHALADELKQLFDQGAPLSWRDQVRLAYTALKNIQEFIGPLADQLVTFNSSQVWLACEPTGAVADFYERLLKEPELQYAIEFNTSWATGFLLKWKENASEYPEAAAINEVVSRESLRHARNYTAHTHGLGFVDFLDPDQALLRPRHRVIASLAVSLLPVLPQLEQLHSPASPT